MARLGRGRLAATARRLRMVSHMRARLKRADNTGHQLRYHARGTAGRRGHDRARGALRQQALVEFSARTGAPLRLVSPGHDWR
jgi:hypothetical protein